MTTEDYNGYTIKCEAVNVATHVARVYDQAGKCIREIFTMHGERNAIKGAKNRIFGFDKIEVVYPSFYRRGLAEVKVLMNRLKNKLARKARKINRQ